MRHLSRDLAITASDAYKARNVLNYNEQLRIFAASDAIQQQLQQRARRSICSVFINVQKHIFDKVY